MPDGRDILLVIVKIIQGTGQVTHDFFGCEIQSTSRKGSFPAYGCCVIISWLPYSLLLPTTLEFHVIILHSRSSQQLVSCPAGSAQSPLREDGRSYLQAFGHVAVTRRPSCAEAGGGPARASAAEWSWVGTLSTQYLKMGLAGAGSCRDYHLEGSATLPDLSGSPPWYF